ANFELKQFTVGVTVSPTEGGSVSGDGTYTYGQSVTVSATAGDNYNFISWTEDGKEVSKETSYTFTAEADRNLVANFELKQFTVGVTVSPTEGGSVSGDGTYTYGQSVTVSATVNNGYVFLGWYRGDDKVTDDPSYSFTVSADIDLIAKFRAKEVYTVIWQNEDGSVIESKTYTEGEDAPTTDIIPTKADDDQNTYTFEKWDDGTVDGKTTTYRPTFTAVPKPVYTVAGEPAAYTLGTSGDLTVTVNREPDDDKCFDHFTGVEIDGKALTEGTDFTAAKGSTVITIKAAALEDLAEGEHTVKVLFDDGDVETKITVKAAEQTSPPTGDGDVIFIWCVLMAISGAILAIAFRKRRTAVR
ncbi:MAG: InlB B-repeat-containing protein, partial [Oscillospiraceae bacterium]|nr:InlB B-repeat-containing protein [Oscillospiraceae bacterium]